MHNFLKTLLFFGIYFIFIANSNFALSSYKLPDGSIYVGTIINGLFNGKGILEWSNGNKYEGEFKNGLMEGNGKYAGKNNNYEGTFKNGLPDGEGEIKYSNAWGVKIHLKGKRTKREVGRTTDSHFSN